MEAAEDGKMEVEAAVKEIKCFKPEEEYEAWLERQDGRTTNVDPEEENRRKDWKDRQDHLGGGQVT